MKRLKYWLVAYIIKPDGNKIPYLTFGGEDENEAYTKGLDLFGGQDFEVIALRASNESEATAMWKRQRLERSGNLSESVKRVRHRRIR